MDAVTIMIAVTGPVNSGIKWFSKGWDHLCFTFVVSYIVLPKGLFHCVEPVFLMKTKFLRCEMSQCTDSSTLSVFTIRRCFSTSAVPCCCKCLLAWTNLAGQNGKTVEEQVKYTESVNTYDSCWRTNREIRNLCTFCMPGNFLRLGHLVVVLLLPLVQGGLKKHQLFGMCWHQNFFFLLPLHLLKWIPWWNECCLITLRDRENCWILVKQWPDGENQYEAVVMLGFYPGFDIQSVKFNTKCRHFID